MFSPSFGRLSSPTPASVAVRGDDAIVLRGDERGARIDERDDRVEDVERGALADARFLAHAVERDLGARHLGLGRVDRRLRRFELRPHGDHVGLGGVACGVEIDALLSAVSLAWRISEYSWPPW